MVHIMYLCAHIHNPSGPSMVTAGSCTAAVGSSIGTAVGVSVSVTFVVSFSMGVLVASVLGYIQVGPKNHQTNQVHLLILLLCMMRWTLIRSRRELPWR